MNLYVRYFDNETVAKDTNEAIEFLSTLPEVKIDNNAASRINTFLESSNLYPFRLKVSYSNYVLFLKTEAETLEQFKEEERLRKEQKFDSRTMSMAEKKKTILDALNEEHVGWYEASLMFKRVVVIPETGKFQYKDTRFTVRLKGVSAHDCYNRIIDHLKGRDDVDPRSQFPSVKSNNYEYKFLGEA